MKSKITLFIFDPISLTSFNDYPTGATNIENRRKLFKNIFFWSFFIIP